MQPDIFICHSAADANMAEAVASKLESKLGFSCWYAKRDMPDASGDTEEILPILSECSVFLLISSPHTSDNHSIQAAVSQALALDKPRLELKIEDNEISDEAFAACYQQLNALLATTEPEQDYEYESRSGFKKHLIYIIILLIGVTGAVLVFNALRGEPREQIGLDYNDEPDMITALEKQAQEGYAEAQYELGKVYNIVQRFEDATYWFRQAAMQGHTAAQLVLANNYYVGIGIERDRQQASYWFYRAGELTNPFMQFDISQMYAAGNILPQDLEQAIYWMRQSAMQGIEEAQVHLGGMYYYGQGTEVDFEQAAYWYGQAAELGNSFGQNNLAIMYFVGSGVQQSYEMAYYWYHQSAQQNNTDGQLNLGRMYEFGQGVDIDLGQAMYWYHRAAELGNVNAMSSYGVLAYQTHEYETAVTWFRRAAELGSVRGQAFMGYMYEHGAGVEQDYTQAIMWYERAQHGGPSWVSERLLALLEEMNDEQQSLEEE